MSPVSDLEIYKVDGISERTDEFFECLFFQCNELVVAEQPAAFRGAAAFPAQPVVWIITA
jgi:hypothetical protein